MRETIIKNAIIKSVEITNGDHGQLSAWLYLDYGGSGQGFGGYSLFSVYQHEKGNVSANYCGLFINSCLVIAGVEKWSELAGKTIRVKGVDFGSIEAIGHITEDKWFNPSQEFEKLQNPEPLT